MNDREFPLGLNPDQSLARWERDQFKTLASATKDTSGISMAATKRHEVVQGDPWHEVEEIQPSFPTGSLSVNITKLIQQFS